jgi:hypothetical protein
MRPRDRWDRREEGEALDEREPRRPSFQPTVVNMARTTVWDSIRSIFRGCLLLILIPFATILLIIYLPSIRDSISNFFSSENIERATDIGIPTIWMKRFIFMAFAGLFLGTMIRILRKI